MVQDAQEAAPKFANAKLVELHEGKDYKFYIPEKVLDCFNDEFDYRFIANCQELTDICLLRLPHSMSAIITNNNHYQRKTIVVI